MFYPQKVVSIILKATDLQQKILDEITKARPQSVEELAKILKDKFNLSEEETLDFILKLQTEEHIELLATTPIPTSFVSFLSDNEAIWYWLTIAVTLLTAVMTFTISEANYPWIYVRNIFGVFFVLFLPGNELLKNLVPSDIAKTSKRSLKTIEHIALSVGISVALVSIMGLLLYYSPWGLDLYTEVTSLFGLTLVFATTAIFGKYARKKQSLKPKY